MLRRVSGPSVRAKASTKGTFCGESQDNPFARGHLPKGHAAGSLRTIRSCEGTFQCDMEQGVPELSTRARVPSKGKCCGESEDHPSVPRRLPREHAAGSLRTIRSRQGTLQRDMLRGVSGQSVRARAPFKGTCCGESQDNPCSRGRLPKGHAAGGIRGICSREGTIQSDVLQEVYGQSVFARAPFKGKCCRKSQDHAFARGHLPRGHPAGSIRDCPLAQGLLPCDHSMRGMSGTSVRLRAPFKETWNGEFQDCPFERGHHPRGHAARSVRKIRSCEGAIL